MRIVLDTNQHISAIIASNLLSYLHAETEPKTYP